MSYFLFDKTTGCLEIADKPAGRAFLRAMCWDSVQRTTENDFELSVFFL